MRSAALIAIACTIACGSTRQSNLIRQLAEHTDE
jgi:hypothetical protein